MNKNFKKLLTGSIFAFAAVPALAGCGSSFNGTTIVFWHTFGQGITGAVSNYADEFQTLVKQHDGVDVRIKMVYKGAYEDLRRNTELAISTGDNPTLAVCYPDHIADYMRADSECAVNMQSLVNDPTIGFGTEEWLGDQIGVGTEDFLEAYYAESTSYPISGVFSIPFLRSTETMLYDMKKVKSAVEKGCFDELDTNATVDQIRDYLDHVSWPQFMDDCRNIYEKMSQISESLIWPIYYDSDANMLISRMFQEGIGYSKRNPDGSGYISFNATRTGEVPPTAEQIENYNKLADVLQEYRDWHSDGLFETKGVNGKEYSSSQFTADKCIFAIGSTGGAGYSLPEDSKFELGVAPVPTFDNNPLYVTQGPSLTILNNSKLVKSGDNATAVKYAWKFIKYLTSTNNNAYICTGASEGYNPVKHSAFNSPIYTAYVESDKNFGMISNCVTNKINGKYFHTEVFTGSAKLRDAMEKMVVKVFKSSDSITDCIDYGLKEAI